MSRLISFSLFGLVLLAACLQASIYPPNIKFTNSNDATLNNGETSQRLLKVCYVVGTSRTVRTTYFRFTNQMGTGNETSWTTFVEQSNGKVLTTQVVLQDANGVCSDTPPLKGYFICPGGWVRDPRLPLRWHQNCTIVSPTVNQWFNQTAQTDGGNNLQWLEDRIEGFPNPVRVTINQQLPQRCTREEITPCKPSAILRGEEARIKIGKALFQSAGFFHLG